MLINSKKYHEETSYQRHRLKGHFLDLKNQPDVFKTYPSLELLKLPRVNKFPAMEFSSLLKKEHAQDKKTSTSDIEELSRILLLTYSITAKARHSGGAFYYRSTPSAGALYPVEIYLAGNGIHGLKDGLYHFSIAQHALFLLRKGHFPVDSKETAKTSNLKFPLMSFGTGPGN